MSISVSGGSFDFGLQSVGGIWSWSVIAQNSQGLNQTYQIANIITPYGPLTDTAIPIPGDVITEMASSLNTVQQQLAPLLAIISPIPSLFNVVVVEGDASSQSGTVAISNVGSFGSFMSVSMTPSVPWLKSNPSFISSLGRGQNAQFSLTINPGSLLSVESPYLGYMNLQDNRVPPTVISIPVNVTVLPRPQISTSPSNIILTYALSTKTPGGAQTFSVINAGPPGSTLNYILSKVLNNSPWLDISPTSGGPLDSTISDIITCSIVGSGVPLTPGTYVETIRVSSGNALNSPIDVQVSLIVT